MLTPPGGKSIEFNSTFTEAFPEDSNAADLSDDLAFSRKDDPFAGLQVDTAAPERTPGKRGNPAFSSFGSQEGGSSDTGEGFIAFDDGGVWTRPDEETESSFPSFSGQQERASPSNEASIENLSLSYADCASEPKDRKARRHRSSRSTKERGKPKEDNAREDDPKRRTSLKGLFSATT